MIERERKRESERQRERETEREMKIERWLKEAAQTSVCPCVLTIQPKRDHTTIFPPE